MPQTTTKKTLGSESLGAGIRVGVKPYYSAEHSKPEDPLYVFGYRITITNESPRWAKLVSRHWIIVNANGKHEEVRGEGVVGQQPELGPGESFEYASYCTFTTLWGTMEGTYTMIGEDGEMFQVPVGRFYLVATGE